MSDILCLTCHIFWSNTKLKMVTTKKKQQNNEIFLLKHFNTMTLENI